MQKRRIPNEAYVYFGLFGNFDPVEITKKIGINPTSACAKGERNPVRELPRTSQWELSTKKVVEESIDIGKLAEKIIEQLEPNQLQIKQTILEYDIKAVLEVVIQFSTDDEVSTPAIGFSPRVIEFLSNVGASIDIDTYLLPND